MIRLIHFIKLGAAAFLFLLSSSHAFATSWYFYHADHGRCVPSTENLSPYDFAAHAKETGARFDLILGDEESNLFVFEFAFPNEDGTILFMSDSPEKCDALYAIVMEEAQK